jgi:MFS family permease
MTNVSSESHGTKTGASAGGVRHIFDALGNTQFRLLWFGMLFSQASMQINLVSRSWLAYSLSGSAVALGAVALARGLPQSILSLLGGAMADRMDKRNLLIAVQCGLSVLAITVALLIHLKLIRVWHLVVIALFQGVVFAFNMPTRQALIPELVPRDLLSNALALNSTGMNLNRVLAPALAGLLIAVNPALSFDVVAAFYIMSALLLLRVPKTSVAAGSHSRNPLVDIYDGIKYIVLNRRLLALIIMAFVPTLFGMPYLQLLPVFQKDVLHVGPRALGMMYTSVGIGALTGSLTVASMAQSAKKNFIQGVAGVTFGVALILFSLSPLYVLSLVLLFGVGLASQGYMTLNNVLLMESTDPAYYGRVMSTYMLTFSMAPVALMPIGFMADHLGVSLAEVIAGAILAVLMMGFLTFGRRMIERT